MTEDSARMQEKLQRKLFRENLHRIWMLAKEGQLNGLTAKERELAEILLDHQEYGSHFENTDILDGREYEAGATFNPFLHISTHRMVEDQLAAEAPIETVLFCESLEDRGLSRHDAIHFVIMILLHVLYGSAASGRSFDAGRYRRLLEECRGVEPERIEGIIEQDLSEYPDQRDLQ
ncbi:MAG: DUF1841 family protein [Deltaproteobacteria bacterium]|nr:DUF1841 family protein [Deltaproteobacteria bacterium]